MPLAIGRPAQEVQELAKQPGIEQEPQFLNGRDAANYLLVSGGVRCTDCLPMPRDALVRRQVPSAHLASGMRSCWCYPNVRNRPSPAGNEAALSHRPFVG